MSPTILKAEGYEHGLPTPSANGTGICDGVTGTAFSIQNTYKHSGSYALRINPLSATITYLTYNYGATGNPVAVYTIYIFVHAWPSAQTEIWMSQLGAGSGARIYLDPVSHGLEAGFASPTVSGPTISLDTWYRLDLKIDCTNNPNRLDWYVEGNAQTQATIAQAATYPSGSRVGVATAVTIDIVYDDMVYSRTAADFPIGPIGIEGLFPNDHGTSNPGAVIQDNNSVTVDDATNPANIELDDIFGSTADYIKQVTNSTTNYAEVAFADTAETNILAVQAYLEYMAAGTSANNGQTRIRDSNGQETTVYSGDMSETSLFYKNAAVLTPSGGWTQAHVNALTGRVGYSNDVAPVPYWEALMLQVVYVPSAGTLYPQSVDGTLDAQGALSKSIRRSLDGTLSSGGNLNKFIIMRALLGTLSSIGGITKRADKALIGVLGSTGLLNGIKIVKKSLDGTLTSAGTLAKRTSRSLTGTLSSGGNLAKYMMRSVSGILSSSGVIYKKIQRTLGGTLGSSGLVNGIKIAMKSIGGALTPIGTVTKGTYRSLAGTLTSSGILIRRINKGLTGTLGANGSLTKRISRNVSGLLTSSGSITKRIAKGISGILSAIGSLVTMIFHGVPEQPGTIDISDYTHFTITLTDRLYGHSIDIIDTAHGTVTIGDTYGQPI